MLSCCSDGPHKSKRIKVQVYKKTELDSASCFFKCLFYMLCYILFIFPWQMKKCINFSIKQPEGLAFTWFHLKLYFCTGYWTEARLKTNVLYSLHNIVFSGRNKIYSSGSQYRSPPFQHWTITTSQCNRDGQMGHSGGEVGREKGGRVRDTEIEWERWWLECFLIKNSKFSLSQRAICCAAVSTRIQFLFKSLMSNQKQMFERNLGGTSLLHMLFWTEFHKDAGKVLINVFTDDISFVHDHRQVWAQLNCSVNSIHFLISYEKKQLLWEKVVTSGLKITENWVFTPKWDSYYANEIRCQKENILLVKHSTVW